MERVPTHPDSPDEFLRTIGRYRLAAVACVLAAATAFSVTAQARAGTAPGTAELVRGGAPGAILLTRHDGRTAQRASGLADVGRNVPMRAGDRFRAGSITKTFVATVVLQLAGEGKLSLDASVESLLPGLVPNGDRITVKELLDHTSGLFDFENDQRVLKPYFSGNLAYVWDPRRLVEIAVSHKPLFAPGARYSYSNTNYLVAGLIVEAVTGKSIESELEQRVFAPLHLRSTAFARGPRTPSPSAHGYYVFDKPPAADITGLSPYPWAAGAIVSTAGDLATFYRALLTGRLLEPDLLRSMQETVPEGSKSDFPNSRYGLGLERYSTPCGVAWGHGGNFPGYLVYAFTSAGGDRQAVLLVNEDPQSLPKELGPVFKRALVQSYCAG